ncbi:hypothetical protein D3Z39_12005 [Anaerotruncus colihominis]|uniref:Uncharacterized protein n=1 Tax=Anaerotruncus colihominis TaxID=169435 RepID=A0A845RKY7_9FIRM|nr:hypothetical protein [Anaerotruncus colihominis]
MLCIYFIMSARRHDKIGHQGGSGLRPRIAPAIWDKINALHLFYHVYKHSSIYQTPVGKPFAYRPVPPLTAGHTAKIPM